MRGYMFRNRWGALLFVGLTLAGVAQLVGTGNGDGAIDAAKGRLVEQKAQAEALGARPADAAAPRAAEVEFASDDDLIDPAVGEDPTPIDQRAPTAEEAEEEAPHDEVILVPDDAAPADTKP